MQSVNAPQRICKRYIYGNGEKIKRVYGYSRLEHLPRLVNPLLLSQ